ncbi:hypothetical protein [Variovorax paradoxus]|uniref:hypothetical protein n=1 Tax=Variovorax paradoxus TaxID=34073 RepID=UPI0030D61F49
MTSPLTVERLQFLIEEDIYIQGLLERRLARTYSEFLARLRADIALAVQELALNPQLFLNESEDATTARLLLVLKGMGYTADHNNAGGGNIDVTVRQIRRGFRWIAEAKKFDDIGSMRDGFVQLSTRYVPGDDNEGSCYGGMIGYLRRPNAAECMNDWRSHFAEIEQATNAAVEDCELLGPFGFNSSHTHKESGLPLKLWHVCVRLFHGPEDKSAKRSKKHAANLEKYGSGAPASSVAVDIGPSAA